MCSIRSTTYAEHFVSLQSGGAATRSPYIFLDAGRHKERLTSCCCWGAKPQAPLDSVGLTVHEDLSEGLADTTEDQTVNILGVATWVSFAFLLFLKSLKV